jgi:hypothetical protein
MNWRQGTIGTMIAGMIAGYSLWWSASARTQTPFGADPRQASTQGSTVVRNAASGNQPADPMEAMMAARTRMERNIDRQKHMENDAQRLLSLANELNAEIASSGAETMTPEMLHKMDEIEKLARSVKDKMRE